MTSLIFGCGVKAAPAKYQESVVDSYIQHYTGNTLTPEEQERVNGTEPIQSTSDQTKKPLPTTVP